MKKVYRSHVPFQVAQLKGILEANHVPCVTRNDFLQGAAGELPPTECWPELWILDDAQLAQAEELVAAFSSVTATSPSWVCEHCGEHMEGQFGSCSHCGRDRPSWAFPDPA